MIRAAWTYVHTFAPDILRAQQRYQELIDNATKTSGDHDARLDRYLADPANPIPVHTAANQEHGGVHWSLLAMMLGSEHSSRSNVFRRGLAAGRRRIFDKLGLWSARRPSSLRATTATTVTVPVSHLNNVNVGGPLAPDLHNVREKGAM